MKDRVSFSKKTREQIANKTNNKCGYCGDYLKKGWHLDHIEPICSNFGTNDFSNLMASCPQCNRFKGAFRLEDFRKEIQLQAERLLKYSVNARMAFKFGLIDIYNKKKVKFYFEIKAASDE